MALTQLHGRGGESLKVEMLASVLEEATRVLHGEEEARHWITTPIISLDQKRPLDHLTSINGYERVKNTLTRIEYGMYLVRAWRIYDHNAAHARQPGVDPLDGAGGLHGHARWHHRGQPILYTASSPSLALLEVLVHIDPRRYKKQTLLQLEIDGDSERVPHAQLVQLLRDAPEDDPEAATRDYGTTWLAERRTLALIVPSLVMPFEDNIILDPLHPDAARTRLAARERLTLDARLLERLAGASPH